MGIVAVVGGGFSGTMTAVNLLRQSARTQVVLIERTGEFGKGLAYGAARESHVLNVPAGRMGAWPDREEDFLDWLRKRDPGAQGGSFVRRSSFGEYLADLLSGAECAAGNGRLRRVASQAIDAAPRPGGGWTIRFESAPALEVDALVLAVGNFAPADPPFAPSLPRETWISDPWAPGALDRIGAADDVLLVGTGLTMYDIALELRDRRFGGRMVALSRRGLRPQPHRASPGKPAHRDPPPARHAWPSTALGMLRGVREEVRRAAAENVDWREVITSLRPVTAELWTRLHGRERSRFLDRLRPYWDSHRHRAAPEIHDAIETLIRAGTLSIRGGRILAAGAEGGRVIVTARYRGEAAPVSLTVNAVINCTGPDSDCRRSGGPLLRSLLGAGRVVSDQHGLGLLSASDGRAIGDGGDVSEDLWLIGPLRRPELWESTAVPELRQQAVDLAAALASRLG